MGAGGEELGETVFGIAQRIRPNDAGDIEAVRAGDVAKESAGVG